MANDRGCQLATVLATEVRNWPSNYHALLRGYNMNLIKVASGWQPGLDWQPAKCLFLWVGFPGCQSCQCFSWPSFLQNSSSYLPFDVIINKIRRGYKVLATGNLATKVIKENRWVN